MLRARWVARWFRRATVSGRARVASIAFALLWVSAPSALAVTTSHIATDTELNALLPVKSFVGEGRIGNNANNGTFELDIGAETSSPAQTAQDVWPKNVDVPFTLAFGGGVASLVVASKTVSYTPTQTPGGDFFVRTPATRTGTSITIHSRNLDGVPIPDQSYAVHGTNGGLDILRVAGADLATPFTLTGMARLNWTGSPPTNSNLAFQLKFGVASGATPPAVAITAPASGTLFGASPIAVSGTVSGTEPVDGAS